MPWRGFEPWSGVIKEITIRIVDPIDQSIKTGIEGEGTMTTWHNLAGSPTRTLFCKADGSAYSEKTSAYDGLNRLAEEHDPLGRMIQYISDSFDRITDTTWPGGRTIKTTYTDQSQAKLPAKVSVKDRSVVGEQRFDGLGRVKVRRVGPRITSQIYQGTTPEPCQISDSQGNIVHMAYESALHYAPTTVTWDECTDTIVYDPKIGKPAELRGSFCTVTRTYDSASHPWKETFEIHGGDKFCTEYSFSIAGRLESYINPNYHQQSVEYDNCGRPYTQTQGDSVLTFIYDTASRLRGYQIEDQQTGFALSSELTHDDFGREISQLVKEGEKTLFVLTQEYNGLGLIQARTMRNEQASFNLRNETFEYDDYNRLKYYECCGLQAPADEQGRLLQSQSFAFDDFDNITTITAVFQGNQGQNVTTYHYSLLDPTRLLKITNDHPEYPREIFLEYDADGRLTRDEQGRLLDYDTLGRLIRVRDEGQGLLCEYRYDASGKLVAQIVPGQPDTYLFYREESLIATKTGECRTSYLSDGKTSWGQIVQDGSEQSQAQFWVVDGHDSVLGWVDSQTPNEVHLQSYTPYGLCVGAETSVGFNGQWRDPITGWYHLGNGYRVYNPVLQRFHCPDPWSPFTSGEINPYSYCLGDPVNRVDPSGHLSVLGIHLGWKTLLETIFGFLASTFAAIFTAGASLAVEVAVGTVAGGVAGATGGALDLERRGPRFWHGSGHGVRRTICQSSIRGSEGWHAHLSGASGSVECGECQQGYHRQQQLHLAMGPQSPVGRLWS